MGYKINFNHKSVFKKPYMLLLFMGAFISYTTVGYSAPGILNPITVRGFTTTDAG